MGAPSRLNSRPTPCWSGPSISSATRRPAPRKCWLWPPSGKTSRVASLEAYNCPSQQQAEAVCDFCDTDFIGTGGPHERNPSLPTQQASYVTVASAKFAALSPQIRTRKPDLSTKCLTAWPAAARKGERMNPGWVAKLLPNCTPPIRTDWPHAPGCVAVSPSRSVPAPQRRAPSWGCRRPS